MVARDDMGLTGSKPVIERLFMAWRRFLWRRWCAMRNASRGFRSTAVSLWHWSTTVKPSDLTRPGGRATAVLSSAAVLLGQTLSVLSSPAGVLRMEALFSSAIVLLSLVLGLAVLAEESLRLHRDHRPLVAAWFIGIVPWSLALAPVLWPLVWLAALWLTRRMVQRAGLGRWALKAVGRAFWAQAAAGIVVWVLLNGLTFLLAG